MVNHPNGLDEDHRVLVALMMEFLFTRAQGLLNSKTRIYENDGLFEFIQQCTRSRHHAPALISADDKKTFCLL